MFYKYYRRKWCGSKDYVGVTFMKVSVRKSELYCFILGDQEKTNTLSSTTATWIPEPSDPYIICSWHERLYVRLFIRYFCRLVWTWQVYIYALHWINYNVAATSCNTVRLRWIGDGSQNTVGNPPKNTVGIQVEIYLYGFTLSTHLCQLPVELIA